MRNLGEDPWADVPYSSSVLDLKAKLAAAGVVTADQVKEFDAKQEKERVEREARKAKKAEQRKQYAKGGKGKGGQKPGKHGGQGGGKQGGPKKGPVDVEALKKENKGEAYNRIRKIVERNRLDKGERHIPAEDESPFNFVTAKGKISRLYLNEATSARLKEGSAGISAFMSHHGLAHCVLPKAIALDLAKVFPLWLRHLRDHPEAGKIEEPEPSEETSEAAAKADEAKAEEAPAVVGGDATVATTDAASADQNNS